MPHLQDERPLGLSRQGPQMPDEGPAIEKAEVDVGNRDAGPGSHGGGRE